MKLKKNKKSVILIVDDKPANILALENLLSNEERITLSATNGEAALKITLEKHVDLIILDVQMPVMDGFEVAQILKSNKRTKNIPIIFATAESKERKLMMKGYDEGAVDYLFKPLDPEIVKAKVTVLLKFQLQQQELLEKNNSLQKSALLINNSADIIGIIDATSFTIEEMNQAFTTILGYLPEEIIERPLSFFLLNDDKISLEKLTAQKEDQLSFETQVHCKNKTIKWLDWKVVVKNKKWYVNARDITEIKKLNSDLRDNVLQLEASNKELESFSYSVSHDLRAPLRALSIYTKILEEDHLPSMKEDAKKIINSIQSNTLKMGRLIDDLLEFSRLGRKDIHRSNVDMKHMAENVLKELGEAKKNNAVVSIGELPAADADPNLVEQVWINLISNAIKYSSKKEKPEIEIGSTSSATENIFFVKDNGSGFDMKYAGKLFHVFQRLHTVSEFEGTGVGLAIVYRIITKHGGRIWAEAKKNEGATFYFSLPVKKGPFEN